MGMNALARMYLGFAGLICLILAGCATGAGDKPSVLEESITVSSEELGMAEEASAEPSGETKEQEAEPQEQEQYRIGPGDVLQFRSFNDEQLSGDIEVRYDGYISLPLIPDVRVEGLTREEATELVRSAYEQEYNDPRLSLSIRDSRSKSYYVMGDVNRPDEYLYTRPITLLDAINASGGVRERQNSTDAYVGGRARLSKAFVIRHQHGKRDVLEYDLRGLNQTGEHVSDTPVYPGDIVYVPETVSLAYVMGEVRRPSAYQIGEGTRLLEVLALAGGPIEVSGRLKQVVVFHQLNEKETRVSLVDAKAILRTGADIQVSPGDIIYVPRKRMTRLTESIRQFQSTVSPLLSTYMQGFDAYYTDQRYRQMVSSSSSSDTAVLTIEQTLRNLQSLTATSATLLP